MAAWCIVIADGDSDGRPGSSIAGIGVGVVTLRLPSVGTPPDDASSAANDGDAGSGSDTTAVITGALAELHAPRP